MTAPLSVNPAALQTALDGLKRRNPGQKPLTNYFLQRLDSVENLRMFESEKSLCFFFDEWDFARLHFYTFDAASLAAELQTLNWPPIVVVDWISKEGPASADMLLSSSGFHLHAIYDRMFCRNLRRESPSTPTQMASDNDTDAIHYSLLRVFDKYADHIISVKELRQLIGQRQVVVTRDPQGKIDGFAIFPISGQSFHFNFLYNSGGPAQLAHLLGSFYGALSERGVQSGVGWVRRMRPQVLRLHQSFGWKTDGLVDYIYLR
jgi:hypothetical protein